MRTRLAFWLDIVILLAVLLTIAIELTGGFHVRLDGVRVSARSPDRALFVAVAVVLVRLAFARGAGFLGVPPARWAAFRRRVYQEDSDAPRPGRLRAGRLMMALAALAAIGAWLVADQLRQFARVPDLGDPLFSMWRIGWVFRQVTGDPRPLFDANIFHPEPLTLTYSDAMLLPALTVAPLLAAGLHPVHVYNTLFLSGFLLSGIAMLLLVWRLTGSLRAALVSAVLYAFYPYRFEHYSHLELQMTYFMPLALLALHRFARTLRARDLLLVVACAAAQLYSSMYYGLFFAIYATVLATVTLRVRGVSWRPVVRPVAAAGLIGIALALPLARPYLAAQARKGQRDLPAVRVYSAMASDYLRAHERSARYGRWLSGGHPERELFPGTVALVLAGGALVPPIGGVTLAYAAGLIAAFDGSLGMNGLAYPYLYDLLLPVRGLRVPARFSMLVGLSLAVLAGLGVARLLRRLDRRKGHTLAGVILLAAAIDLAPVLRLEDVWRHPPRVYDAIGSGEAPGPRGAAGAGYRPDLPVLAEFPLPTSAEQLLFNLPFMYFSIWHGLPLVNGYSGFAPPDYEQLIGQLSAFPDPRSVRLLRERGVTHVTLNCALYGPGCDASRAAFSASPALRLIVEEDWEGAPVLLYELAAGAPGE